MPKFLNDIKLEQANDIQFKTTAGANAGKIEQDGNNLVLSNAVGDILLGDGASDVYIGDGTNNVDIIFEQSGSIKGDGSAVTLTLGGSNTTLNLENPNINGSLSIGATTINNKLTFTTNSGYILFDYEPSGDTAEYTTEVPLIKVGIGTGETTILARVSEYRGVVLGADDTVWLQAGDTKSVIKTNVNLTAEQVLLSAEGGFHAYGFPSNDTSWANRVEFKFRTDSGTASENGLYIGDAGYTQFIDLSRNLVNIGSITATSLDINGNADISGYTYVGGQFRWAIDGSNYAYSDTDGSGLYIENVGATDAKSDIRIQARASGAGNYSYVKIRPSVQDIQLGTNNGLGLTIDSSNDAIFSGIVNIVGTNSTNQESVLLRGITADGGDLLGSIRTANTGGYNQEMRFYTSNANGTSDEDLTLTLHPTQNATFAGTLTVNGADAITIPDYILHAGDDSKFGFPSNDNFKIRLGGVDRFNMTTTTATFTGSISSPSIITTDTSNTVPSANVITNKILSQGYVAANGNTRTGLDVETTRRGWYNSNATAGNFKVSGSLSGARIGASDLIGVKSLASFDTNNVYSGVSAQGSLTALYGKVTTTFTTGSSPIEKGYGLRIDAPEVASSSEISTYYGAYIDGGSVSGTLTNKYALVTEADAGNVGIGTTDPAYAKLQVNGTTLFQGASQIQGDLSLRGNVKDLNKAADGFLTTKTRNTSGSELELEYDYVKSFNATSGGDIAFGGGLTITHADGLFVKNPTNGGVAQIKFSDAATNSYDQVGHIKYQHGNTASYGSGESFIIGGNQTDATILADGKLMYKEGVYSKPSSGTGAGTRKDANWDTAYTHSQSAHAPSNAQANVAPTTAQVKTALNANLGTVTVGDADDDINIQGNLTVTGVTTMSGGTVINTTTNTAIKDTTIFLNSGITGSGAGGSTPANVADIGLILDRGSTGNVFMGWDESEDEFIFAKTSSEGSDDVGSATGGGTPGIVIDNEETDFLHVKVGTLESVGAITSGSSAVLTAGTAASSFPSGLQNSNVTSVTGSSGSCTGNAASVTNGVYTTGDQTIAGNKTFSGVTQLDGCVVYSMSAGQLTTTGFACAGLSSASNGGSALFTFECAGSTNNSYQRIVYNCHNNQGTWNTTKCVDEGGNKFDVVASANASTITFTFKGRSATQNYTPRVMVKAMGQGIVKTYT